MGGKEGGREAGRKNEDDGGRHGIMQRGRGALQAVDRSGNILGIECSPVLTAALLIYPKILALGSPNCRLLLLSLTST